MSFTSFTRQGHAVLSPKILAALAELGTELGVEFDINGGQIGNDSLMFKLTAKTADKTAQEAAAKRQFGLYASMIGLEADDYGIEFRFNSKPWRLTGISPNRPKYPIDAISLRDGRGFKLPKSAARDIIAARASTQAAANTTTFAPANPIVGAGMFDAVAQF